MEVVMPRMTLERAQKLDQIALPDSVVKECTTEILALSGELRNAELVDNRLLLSWSEDVATERARAEKSNAERTTILAALVACLQKGHHDTCSHALGAEYECSCGVTAGLMLIAKIEEAH